MKKTLIISLAIFILTTLFSMACGTTTSNIDRIQERVDKNKCRMNREDLIYHIQDLEYLHDTTYIEIPQALVDDSLLSCPATGELYLLEADGDDRMIICPTGHGDSSL